MKLSQFDFHFPPELVAQYPSVQRGQSKLLVAHRKTKAVHHTTFEHVIDFLEPNDCLVVNDTRVFKARLLGRKETGGKAEIFLLERHPPIESGASSESSLWKCLYSGSIKRGQKIIFKNGLAVTQDILEGQALVRFECQTSFKEFLEQNGHMPLPPYIERSDEVSDCDRYQTIFATHRFDLGAVAAPTAGLHWTEALLQKVKDKGIEIVPITLHVGIGTFLPIRTENILDHKMHAEYFEISNEVAQTINDAKRVVAVGTTTVRALESSAQKGKVKPCSGWTDLFIYPEIKGFQFQVVGALQTNFHQPKSSLLVMVSAFAGCDFILRCYEEAIAHRYQLFSYGDTMLIL